MDDDWDHPGSTRVAKKNPSKFLRNLGGSFHLRALSAFDRDRFITEVRRAMAGRFVAT